MPNVSFTGLLIVAVVAFAAPLVLALTPARRLPAIVLEIVMGIVLGPSVLGWVKIDLPISILSVLGLAFLLFLLSCPWDAWATATKLVLLGGFALLAAGFAFVVLRLERSTRIAAVLLRLQDSTAQIRVRGAFMLLVAFVALAAVLGLETI